MNCEVVSKASDHRVRSLTSLNKKWEEKKKKKKHPVTLQPSLKSKQ